MRNIMWNETSTCANPTSQQVPPMTGLPAKRKRDDAEELLPAAKVRMHERWLPACAERAPPWPPEDDSPPESDDEDDDDDLLMPPVEPRAAKQPPYNYPNKPYFESCNTDGGTPPSSAYYRPTEPYCPPPRFTQRPQPYWPSPPYCYPSENPQVQSTTQTIRCAENGKSYLELGSSPAITTTKCRTANYRQQRLAVLNISMCKLSRFRQFPDPSLHRSVLICNTLRRIEREMEHDSQFFCSEPPPTPAPIHYPSSPSYPATPPPQDIAHYEHSLRELASPAPRATPFPSPTHPSTDDTGSTINWGSVLSLSSQSDLDPLNNNGCSGGSSLLDDLDSELLPSWRLATPIDDKPPDRSNTGEELVMDSLMHVLVGT